MIFTVNGKDLKAKTLTFGDWDFLGQYLKSRLLNDLKFVDEASLRRELQMNIQLRDYGSLDVVNCRRLDVYQKIWYISFGHNVGLTEAALKEFINDDNIFEITKQIFEASGIKYESESEDEAENPPSGEGNHQTSE